MATALNFFLSIPGHVVTYFVLVAQDIGYDFHIWDIKTPKESVIAAILQYHGTSQERM